VPVASLEDAQGAIESSQHFSAQHGALVVDQVKNHRLFAEVICQTNWLAVFVLAVGHESVFAQPDQVVGVDQDRADPHQRSHAHGVPRVVGEGEEGAHVRDEPAMERESAGDRRHRVDVAQTPARLLQIGLEQERHLRLGFKRALVPHGSDWAHIDGLKVVEAATVGQACTFVAQL